jgi:hypothetical protein
MSGGYREAAGGIPESAREAFPVYPAGCLGTPADPNVYGGGVQGTLRGARQTAASRGLARRTPVRLGAGPRQVR